MWKAETRKARRDQEKLERRAAAAAAAAAAAQPQTEDAYASWGCMEGDAGGLGAHEGLPAAVAVVVSGSRLGGPAGPGGAPSQPMAAVPRTARGRNRGRASPRSTAAVAASYNSMEGVGNSEALLDARERRHADGQYSHAEGSTHEMLGEITSSDFDSDVSSVEAGPAQQHLSPIASRGACAQVGGCGMLGQCVCFVP